MTHTRAGLMTRNHKCQGKRGLKSTSGMENVQQTQAAINKERVNVAKRTLLRIAQLFAESEKSIGQVNVAAQQDRIPLLAEKENWHCCLNTICFCVVLLLLNLLFFQWLYYQTVSLHKL
jgi:hypothetical protein